MEITLLLLVFIILLFVLKAQHRIIQAIGKIREDLDNLKTPADTPHASANAGERVAAARRMPSPPHVPDPPTSVSVHQEPVIKEPVTAGIARETEEKMPAIMPPEMPAESRFGRWLRNNPDIEKFIGEDLVNKVGITVLVLGIAFFVKYAIDQDWINKIGRVCIGLLCGGLLMGFAHRLRKQYHSFSSVLVGGGLTVFYFTIAFAFHQYQLFGQGLAFAIMVLITVFAVILSVLYDRLELGILATIGGFITPFLVSTGAGNYLVLFSYLTILNAGLIALAYHKRWRILNFLAFAFTGILYLAFITGNSHSPGFSYPGLFIFGAVFYILFIVMNVIHHVGHGSRLKAFDFIILLSVNLFFYGSGLFLLQAMGWGEYRGLFTALLGLLNLGMAYFFFYRAGVDKHFIYLLIGITLSFISLAAPVQLHGHYITLFWAAESVVLLWLYQRSRIGLLKIASLLITGMMLVSLAMDWSAVYFAGQAPIPVIFNKGFITGFCCALATGLAYTRWRAEKEGSLWGLVFPGQISGFYLRATAGLLFLSGFLEISLQFTTRFPGTGLESVYRQLYAVAFLIVLFQVLKKIRTRIRAGVAFGFPLLLFAGYLLNAGGIHNCAIRLLESGQNKIYFLGSWISAALYLLLAYQTLRYMLQTRPRGGTGLRLFSWIISPALLFILSIELWHLLLWLNYAGPGSLAAIAGIYGRAGLSILWGSCSFIMIWLGIKRRFKPLRILGLLVFGITLLKLFIYDIRHIGQGDKILAFILLGLLLLIVSFLYQRLKKAIIDDEHPTA